MAYGNQGGRVPVAAVSCMVLLPSAEQRPRQEGIDGKPARKPAFRSNPSRRK